MNEEPSPLASPRTPLYRVLTVDDNPAIHVDFKKILCPKREMEQRTDAMEQILFDAPEKTKASAEFELDAAFQGQEALEKLKVALAEDRPYALAFVDVRMPPGWDGFETANRLWELYPSLQIVICTAYSDYTWDGMRAILKQPDSLVVLKKPFDNVEVQQLAHTLTRKWELNQQAERGIDQLEETIRSLIQPLSDHEGRYGAKMDDGEEAAPVAAQAIPFSKATLDEVGLPDSDRLVSALNRLKTSLESTRQQLRQAEQKMVQTEKMASLGRLSAGIIHEINNPLNYVLAAVGTLESGAKYLPPEVRKDHDEAVSDIQDGLQRVAEITTSLRKFAHPTGGPSGLVQMNDSISTALRLMAAELRNEVEISKSIPENFSVWASSSKLTQVFVNLIHNAVDALRTKTFPPGTGPRIGFETGERNGMKTVKVWDNGPGIAEEYREKIFDPFFTTKDVGKGTGMGLGICYQILTQFGASVTVKSEMGVGTEFELSFPMDEMTEMS